MALKTQFRISSTISRRNKKLAQYFQSPGFLSILSSYRYFIGGFVKKSMLSTTQKIIVSFEVSLGYLLLTGGVQGLKEAVS